MSDNIFDKGIRIKGNDQQENKLSLANIGSEKLSSKLDSDLLYSEKLIRWDWLREAQRLNSAITQTCFLRKHLIRILALYLDFKGAKNIQVL